MKLDSLEPAFRTKVEAFIARLKQMGINALPVQSRRTIAEQNGLYAKGRTAPGLKVTNAKGGDSPHNFGLAVDLCPVGKNGNLWWTCPNTVWRSMADQAKVMGLVPGFYFKSIHDPDHFEDPTWRTARSEWRAGKIKVA